MRNTIITALLSICATAAHAGWFGPDFETILTQPPKNGEDSVLYMTNNGFTADEKYFIFGRRHEPRSAGKGLGSRHHYYRRDMTTGEEVEIAYDPDMGFLNGTVSGSTLFYGTYGANAGIYAVDILTKETKQIWKLPPNSRYKWKLGDLSAALDGTRVSIVLSDNVPVKRGDKLNDWLDQYLASDAQSFIYVGRLEDGKWSFTKAVELLSVKNGWFNHAQLNPATGEDILIELEGRCVNGIFDRASVIDLKTGAWIPVRKGETPACLSHANYIADGQVQYMIYEQGSTKVGLADVRKGTWQEWSAGNHMHFAAFIAPDGTFYAFGDGSSKGSDFVTRYTIRGGKIASTDRVGPRGSNTAWEEYHAHPRISPKAGFLVFTTSDRMEHGQVVIVKDPLKAK